MKTGVLIIADERQKQIDKYGFTAQQSVSHPEWYDNYQLQLAAFTLLAHEFEEQVEIQTPDGWDEDWVKKMNSNPRLERLTIAGALIAAEIDRIINS